MQSHEVFDADQLSSLVDHFYARVRRDEQLGPVFESAVADWHEHLHKLTNFWVKVMNGAGDYKGNPMVAHARHADAITPALFTRWLALWAEVTDEVMAPEAAKALQAKAARMSVNLQHALFSSRAPEVAVVEGAAADGAVVRPYRMSSEFDAAGLPPALQREHRTKAGVWGVIRVLEGQLKYVVLDPPAEHILTVERPGMVLPEQPHRIEPMGDLRVRIEFYDRPPLG